MDYLKETVDNAQEEALEKQGLAAFGISLQGASHLEKDPPVPCQDAHAMRWLEKQKLLIAAIADGVGCCDLSHWGAHTAVETALSTVEQGIRQLSAGGRLELKIEDSDLKQQMKALLQNAFSSAQDSVESMAMEGDPQYPVFAFQSTLTLAVYDGKTLMFGHVGDDGIVAQRKDGSVAMVTQRVKGEEANSVFPLQSDEKYRQFGAVTNVAGFLMATDGVLDAFVDINSVSPQTSYFNGVYYPFMEPAMYNIADHKAESTADLLKTYKNWLMSEEYRKKVVDDLTLVAVMNSKEIAGAIRPQFSENTWKNFQQEKQRSQQKLLYKDWNSRQKNTPVLPVDTTPADNQSAPKKAGAPTSQNPVENPVSAAAPSSPDKKPSIKNNHSNAQKKLADSIACMPVGSEGRAYNTAGSGISHKSARSSRKKKKRRPGLGLFNFLLLLMLILFSILFGFLLGRRQPDSGIESESTVTATTEVQTTPWDPLTSPEGNSINPGNGVPQQTPMHPEGAAPQQPQLPTEGIAPQQPQAPNEGDAPQQPQKPAENRVGSSQPQSLSVSIICRGYDVSRSRSKQILIWRILEENIILHDN